MAFHFALQSVLHFRQTVEHQQELRVRAANQRVAGVRHNIAQLADALKQLQTISSQELARGTTSAELRFSLQAELALGQQRQDFEHELLRLSKLRDQQVKIFQQVRRERETIQALRDQQLHAHKREATRREQRRIDDLFLMQRSFRQRG
jgi:flagellar export protein FliJ